MRRQPFIDLRAQYEALRSELAPELEAAFASGVYIGGERVRRFENEFAAFCGRAHCVGVANGTDALRLALMAVGVGPGDEVITVPNSFVATVEAILDCHARPVFVDVRPNTLLMNVEQLERVRTPRTRAVLPVHLHGRLGDMEAVVNWAAGVRVALVEDAAQAHGARWRGRMAGAFGDAGAFSFYPSKNLGAAGDAGAVVTDYAEVANCVRLLRDHGQSNRYVHDIRGFNSRLDALQAAVLSVKLRHLERWNERRRRLVKIYRKRLEALPTIELPSEPKDPENHVYHVFVVQTDERDALRSGLAEKGIETGLHYCSPIHLQPAYRDLGYGPGSFPVAEAAARRLLSLPLYPELSDEGVHQVCDAVEDFFKPR